MTHINLNRHRLYPRDETVRILRVIYACHHRYAQKFSTRATAADIEAVRADARRSECPHCSQYPPKER